MKPPRNRGRHVPRALLKEQVRAGEMAPSARLLSKSEQKAGRVMVRKLSPSCSTLLVIVIRSRTGLAPHCIPQSNRMLAVISTRLFIAPPLRNAIRGLPILTAVILFQRNRITP
jgi:hypothetical protein